jgi:hypothetical protein
MKKKELLRKIEELKSENTLLRVAIANLQQQIEFPQIWTTSNPEIMPADPPGPMAPTIWLGEEVKLSGTIKTASSMNSDSPFTDWYITDIDDPLTFTA